MEEQIEQLISATKKYVDENRKRVTKEQFVKALQNNSNIHAFINYTAGYGLNKEYLIKIKATKMVLKNLSLIGL